MSIKQKQQVDNTPKMLVYVTALEQLGCLYTGKEALKCSRLMIRNKECIPTGLTNLESSQHTKQLIDEAIEQISSPRKILL